ncbi:hypothetical protein ACB098_10G082000 [Castanea mollissima]
MIISMILFLCIISIILSRGIVPATNICDSPDDLLCSINVIRKSFIIYSRILTFLFNLFLHVHKMMLPLTIECFCRCL